MSDKRITTLLVPLFLLGGVLQLSAEIEIYPSGNITASTYVIPADEKPFNTAGLRGAFNLDAYIGVVQFRFSLELYSNFAGIMDDSSYSGEWYYPIAYEGSWNDRTLFSADLKEAWVGFALGDFDLNLGKQIITWGQADGINPTDNVNPQYIGTRSLSKSMEKKIGVPMVNIVYYLPVLDGSIQGIFMPLASYNIMPPFSDSVQEIKPELDFRNMEGGLRIILYPGPVSLSLSYLSILDRYPTDAMETISLPPTFTVTIPSVLGHTRQHIIGFDAVWLVNGFDLRTEWALTLTNDIEGTDPFAQNPFINGVVQASRTFFNGTTTISLSWSPKFILMFQAPEIPPSAPYLSQLYIGQGFIWENMVGIRFQSKFFNETLQPEAMFLAALSAKDFLITAGITYNLADGWNIKAGVNIYGSFLNDSNPDRQLGAFGNDYMIDNDSFYLEIRFDF